MTVPAKYSREPTWQQQVLIISQCNFKHVNIFANHLAAEMVKDDNAVDIARRDADWLRVFAECFAICYLRLVLTLADASLPPR